MTSMTYYFMFFTGFFTGCLLLYLATRYHFKNTAEKNKMEGETERSALVERLRSREEQIQELIQKQQLLDTPGAICPLCEQNLDGHYHQQVIQKTQEQQQQLQDQIWVLIGWTTCCRIDAYKLLQHQT